MLKSNKLVIAFLLLFSIFVVQGCGTDPVQEDLINYLNTELPKVTSLERKATEEYSSITGANYTNDLVMFEAMTKSIIPTYSQFLEELEKIKPATPEVQKIHDQFILAATTQHSGFITTVSALEKQDYAKIATANKKLAEGRKLMRDYQAAIMELADSHEVTITETK
ncbi:hypothetical protein POF51_30645 [Brevibacillus sp. AG]|uniref:hypothetical protein n=1 Tax=Brevibacillus sp. AG TaxID=3020891 RepID=UPI000853EAAF|nr:hypothetical protein [Brevibacillus sp. AG]MDC0765085.1 hypothetical protein [Brevibacillus sp. AG]